ncbi:MAG: efflux RND transporter permease subunit, partial [Cellulosilyticum sp.]|nr:efflux RND transporter permease subunit [Cellulosilyticum sp.]
MDIIKFSIKRPVTILMCILVAVILGIVSLNKMDMELMSSIDLPYALVITSYKDAGPEEIESLITEPIEGAIANVQNINAMMSTSSEGTSIVGVEFEYGTDMDEAITDMKEKIDLIQMILPDSVDKPTVLKMDMNSPTVANIAITSDTLSNNELLSLVEDTLKPRFERQSDVASVDLVGGKETEIIVEINPEKMEGLGLSMQQIAGILAAENQNQSGGTVDYGDKSLTISSKLKMVNIDDVRQTPITLGTGAVVQLQDIAKITEQDKEVTSISRYNGEECIALQ